MMLLPELRAYLLLITWLPSAKSRNWGDTMLEQAIPDLKKSSDYLFAIGEASEEKNALLVDALRQRNLPHIQNRLRILEVGPGSGESLKTLVGSIPEMREEVHITSLDLIQYKDIAAQLARMHMLTEYSDLTSGVAQQLPFESESFSAVNISAVLHEVYSYGGGLPAVGETMREITRVLVPAGVVCIRDPWAPDEDFMRGSSQVYKSPTWIAFLKQFLPDFVQQGVALYRQNWNNIQMYQSIDGNEQLRLWQDVNQQLPLRMVAPIGLQREIQRHYVTLREYLIRMGALGLLMEEPHWKHPLYENKPLTVRDRQGDTLAHELLSTIGKPVAGVDGYQIQGSLLFDKIVDLLMYRFFADLEASNSDAVHFFSDWWDREGREYYCYLGLSDFLVLAARASLEQSNGEYVLLPSSTQDIQLVPRYSYQMYLETALGAPFFEGKQMMRLKKYTKQKASDIVARLALTLPDTPISLRKVNVAQSVLSKMVAS